MSCIINIETATNICSVAVSINNKTVFEKVEKNGPSHATILGVFVQQSIAFIKQNEIKLDAVAVSCGPGSYTGLRIGVSEAKGLCYGLSIPLIAINTTLIMASKVAKSNLISDDTLLCPMIDAKRMEVYSAIYNKQLNLIRDIQADIVNTDSYHNLLDTHKVAFFGNGSEKCKESLSSSNAIFIDSIHPLAQDMSDVAHQYYHEKRFVDVAYFEPFYLKEFIATTPKNKILNL